MVKGDERNILKASGGEGKEEENEGEDQSEGSKVRKVWKLSIGEGRKEEKKGRDKTG